MQWSHSRVYIIHTAIYECMSYETRNANEYCTPKKKHSKYGKLPTIKYKDNI